MSEASTAKKEALAYIEKETFQASKENPDIERLSKETLAKAEELMERLDKAGLTTQSETREGKVYTDKSVIKVEPATKWNNESKNYEPLFYKDGTPVYKAVAELKHDGTTLSFFAKETRGEAKFIGMSASKWDRNDGKPKLNFYRQDEIPLADINPDMKKVVGFAMKEGLVEDRETNKMSELKAFVYDINRYFNANSEKTLTESGSLVNNAYAKYENDRFGEKILLKNHEDNIVVEIGMTSQNDKYAMAVNYSLNKDNEPRLEGQPPVKVYINNTKDILSYISCKEIQDIVSEFKGFQKDMSKNEKKQKEPERG